MAKTILIVEDNELNMKLFSDLLQAYGYETLKSVDGMDCLQLAREHRPDLIIMDIQLPVISGLEHTRMLKSDNDLKDIPVVACTAFAMRDDEKKILDAGCDGYIPKPISVPNFLETVRSFLTMRRFEMTYSLKIGHSKIDAEHEHLVALFNEFLDCVDNGDATCCAEKVAEITEALKSHFDSEERIMETFAYGQLEGHKEEHRNAIREYESLIGDAERNGYGNGFINELSSLLANNIVGVDLG